MQHLLGRTLSDYVYVLIQKGGLAAAVLYCHYPDWSDYTRITGQSYRDAMFALMDNPEFLEAMNIRELEALRSVVRNLRHSINDYNK